MKSNACSKLNALVRSAGEEEDDEIGRLMDDPNTDPAELAERVQPTFELLTSNPLKPFIACSSPHVLTLRETLRFFLSLTYMFTEDTCRAAATVVSEKIGPQ
jgi:hypothetical protein